MKPVRVLVVEDSLTARRYLCEVLGADPGIEVVGEAADGKRAIELCAALRPDAVTLDMMLPVMSGLAATEYIMAHCPTPILIVSSSTNRGELFKTYEALAAGALEVLEKPLGSEADADWEHRLVETVRLISRIRVITHPRGRARQRAQDAAGPRVAPQTDRASAQRFRLVGIGASTGGPAALVELLSGLPPGFPLPVLIVLHIDEPFAASFADWLDGQTPHRVRFAAEGQLLGPPGVWLAPPGQHLVVRDHQLQLESTAERHSCRPSVDVLFESLARECGSAAMACLLTGMGRDGAQGLLEIHRAGGFTIAQDEASCVVYGMPREAVLLGAAECVLPLAEIGPALAALVGRSARESFA